MVCIAEGLGEFTAIMRALSLFYAGVTSFVGGFAR